MKNRPSIGPGAMFIVIAAVLFLVGPTVEALVYPYVVSSPTLSYAVLFIPYILASLPILALGGIGALEGKDGKSFSIKKALFFLFLSLLFLAFSSLLDKPAPSGHPKRLIILSLVVTVLFIPIQTGVEEYLFRVLPIRMVPSWPEKKMSMLLISAASGLLFTVPHMLNPEATGDGGGWALLHYFLWGLLASLSALVSGGFEIPFALHAANNLFIGAVMNYPGSALPSFPLFIATETGRGVKEIIVTALHFAFVLAAFYIKERKKRHAE
ncbi:MAG: lysostaphin resistance A-like protein [Candidatus Ornithospirochaeta sp.]